MIDDDTPARGRSHGVSVARERPSRTVGEDTHHPDADDHRREKRRAPTGLYCRGGTARTTAMLLLVRWTNALARIVAKQLVNSPPARAKSINRRAERRW